MPVESTGGPRQRVFSPNFLHSLQAIAISVTKTSAVDPYQGPRNEPFVAIRRGFAFLLLHKIPGPVFRKTPVMRDSLLLEVKKHDKN
jgi:hypothetical protein